MSRLDRKSVSFALFSAFLARLETTYTATAPAGYPRTELLRLMREAALEVAVERVNEEWERIARREQRIPCFMRHASPDTVLVVDQQGRLREPFRLEVEDLRKYARRLTRGLPELGEVVA